MLALPENAVLAALRLQPGHDLHMIVRALEDKDGAAWDAYVFGHDQGTFFHRVGWQTIFEKVFGLKTRFLLAESGGKIVGVLPLVHQRSVLFGNALISAPFCVEGGPLASSVEALRALDDAAVGLMKQTGAGYIEFRSKKATRPEWTSRKNLYATFKRAIFADEQKNLLAIPRKQRAVVRKTLQGSLTSEIDQDPKRLFAVYAESVRNLGTPVFSRRYFVALKHVFGDDCDIVVILDAGIPVSAVLNFYFKDIVLPYYGGGTIGARKTGANDFLYWEVMRRAAQRNYTQFDFGRSKADTGPFAFKKNWGFEPTWLEYEYYLRPGTALPEKNPTNPKFSLAIEAWKRLPLPIANFVGPFLVRNLG